MARERVPDELLNGFPGMLDAKRLAGALEGPAIVVIGALVNGRVHARSNTWQTLRVETVIPGVSGQCRRKLLRVFQFEFFNVIHAINIVHADSKVKNYF